MVEIFYSNPRPLSEENSSRPGYRYFDSQGRLVAWSIREFGRVAFFQVKTFKDVALESGEKLVVPEAIVCTFTGRELDPNFELEKGETLDLSIGEVHRWTPSE